MSFDAGLPFASTSRYRPLILQARQPVVVEHDVEVVPDLVHVDVRHDVDRARRRRRPARGAAPASDHRRGGRDLLDRHPSCARHAAEVALDERVRAARRGCAARADRRSSRRGSGSRGTRAGRAPRRPPGRGPGPSASAARPPPRRTPDCRAISSIVDAGSRARRGCR